MRTWRLSCIRWLASWRSISILTQPRSAICLSAVSLLLLPEQSPWLPAPSRVRPGPRTGPAPRPMGSGGSVRTCRIREMSAITKRAMWASRTLGFPLPRSPDSGIPGARSECITASRVRSVLSSDLPFSHRAGILLRHGSGAVGADRRVEPDVVKNQAKE